MAQSQLFDQYISTSQPFAKPLLAHFREVVNRICPEVEEAKKWGSPHFLFKDRMMCSMAAYSKHVSLGFAFRKELCDEMQSVEFSTLRRISSMSDFPDDQTLAALVRRSMELISSGAKPALWQRKAKPIQQNLAIPEDLELELAADPVVKANFDAFSLSKRKEYAIWIGEAKREQTRAKRLATAIGQIRDGKHLYWKYDKC